MIQDIGEHTFDNQYHPCPPDRESYALYYEDHAALVRKYPDRIEFPKFRDIERLNEDIYEDAVYLFSIDGERYYLVEEINRERQSHFTMENTEIFRYAESCHNMEFPKICPAVIIGVTDGDKILMSKYAGRTYKKYALLAGFTEIGETLEETVQREVMEEVGLKVKNIRYYKSQPWSFTDTLLMGFYCDLDGGAAITLDREELAMAEWFQRDEIPVEPERDSITNEMIIRFKNGEV